MLRTGWCLLRDMGVKGRLQVLAYLERSMELHDTAMVQGTAGRSQAGSATKVNRWLRLPGRDIS